VSNVEEGGVNVDAECVGIVFKVNETTEKFVWDVNLVWWNVQFDISHV